MAYDAARTLSLMMCDPSGYRQSGRRTLQHLSCARNSGWAVRQALAYFQQFAIDAEA